ncbi:hypothetical protein N9L19_00645 [bacterium]|nr:hypothetical protein [bacterium]
MRDMLEAMRAGGDAETLRAIAAEPEVEPPFVADPESPAAVKLAEEIWRDTVAEKSRQARREAHERELDAQLEEGQRKLRPEYCGCSHPFKYGGVEVSEMKKPSVHEQVGLIKEELRDRKVLLNPGDFSKLPQFLNVYVELFGGPGKRGDNVVKAAKEIYEKITGETVPETSKLDLEVREKVERITSGDPTLTRCRTCTKKFQTKSGEVVCSETCRKKHQSKNDGLVCQGCAKPIERRGSNQMFYNPGSRAWHFLDILEKSTEEIVASFPPNTGMANFVLETKKEKDPIIFCSKKCEKSWMGKLSCNQCGGLDGKTEKFPKVRPLHIMRDPEYKHLQYEYYFLTTTCSKCCGPMFPRVVMRYDEHPFPGLPLCF